jgi:hypothetical protein
LIEKKNLGQDAKIHHKFEDEMRVTLRTTLMCAVQKLSFWMKMKFWMDDLMEEIGKCLVQNHEKRIDPFMDEIRCIQMNYWLVWMDAHSL